MKLNISTVCKLSSKQKQNVKITTPKKRKPGKKPIVDIDKTCEVNIRNTIYEMYSKSKVGYLHVEAAELIDTHFQKSMSQSILFWTH